MKGKELKLMIVGGMPTRKNLPTSKFFKAKSDELVSEEQVPQEQGESFLSQQNICGIERVKRFKGIFMNEDPRKSRFIYAKVIMMEKLSCVLTAIIFLLSCAKTEADIIWETPHQDSSRYLMNALSVCTLGLVFVLTLRQVGMFELETCQNKAYRPKYCSECKLLTFLKHSGRVSSLLIQIMIILPHPVTILTGETFTLFQTYDEIYLNHSWNDLLSLLLSVKVIIIFRALLTLSDYASPRSSRLCHQNGFQHNSLYIIKCLIHQHPLFTIGITFGILIAISSYCLKLAEGVLFLYNSQLVTGFQSYSNCVWVTFITMSTVGYGDLYPKTLLGRVTMLYAAIFGVFLSSLLIVSLSLYLQMIPSESKSHLILTRLEEQKSLIEEASKAVVETVRIKKLMGQLDGKPKQKLQREFMILKERVEGVKMYAKEIKSLVDRNNLMEEMSRLFYILKDNLKDIFRNQMEMKRQIQKINEISKINLSFKKEMSEMLSKQSYPSFTTYSPRPITTTKQEHQHSHESSSKSNN